jgi:hypothetical protein
LIATPGRLQDHIDTTPGFPGRLWGVQVCHNVTGLQNDTFSNMSRC